MNAARGDAPRAYRPADFEQVLALVNDGAGAYRGVIPDDCWHEPYMSAPALAAELAGGVDFSLLERDDLPRAVMGVQDRGEVTLIRHAYVASGYQRSGLGSRLLAHLLESVTTPVLVGTWAAADWAIAFYRRHGFRLLGAHAAGAALRRYWTVPPRQVASSVVLADPRFDTARLSDSPQ